MIDFFSENDFQLARPDKIREWLLAIISSEIKKEGDIVFIFCKDEYLLNLNKQFLDHDTLTDVIGFDDSVGTILNGEIYISTDRVADNAKEFEVTFDNELRRVMAHGILHFCGYTDKTEEDAALMREKEDEKLKMFHVEQ